MLSLMSVTVCAMALVFGVVVCQVYKCPDGYPTQCIDPKETCPKFYMYSGPCPNTYLCCYDVNALNKQVCECQDITTFNTKLCKTLSSKPCQKCCFRCPNDDDTRDDD